LLAGLTLSLIGAGSTTHFVAEAAGRVSLSLLFALAASMLLLHFLPRTPIGRGLVLDTGLGNDEGWAAPPERELSLAGHKGRAHSTLRPSGIAEIDGARVDVVTEGDLIEAGTPIVVARVDGNRVVVRRQLT
jgi:membrane-bound serine protease (ClpP class)